MEQEKQFNNCNRSGPRLQNTEQEYFITGLPNRQDFKLVIEPGTGLLDGRYVTKELLHSGGYSDLYLAFDSARGHLVALKIAAVTPGGGEEIEKFIRNELTVNSRIVDYTHLLRIFDIHQCCHNGINLLLLSMEYADGGSLRQWLTRNTPNLELRRSEGLGIFKQICQGLVTLHNQDILHLDLKPENILFVNGTVKIADLGVSRLMHSARLEDQQQETNISPEMGTAAYMSPEQFLAPHPWDIDLRSDIYSLTLILFEICHCDCRPPFSGTLEFLRYRHIQVSAPEIPDLDENTRRVIARGLKKSPMERYQSVADLLLDIEGRLQQNPNEGTNQSIEDIWIEVLESLQAQDFDGALALCSRILDSDPTHEKASVALVDLNERFRKARQFYSAIHAGIRNEPVNHLVSLLLEAISIYPNHPDNHLVQMELSSLCHEYSEAMEAAWESAESNQWANTANGIQYALQTNPGSFIVRRALEHATRQQRLQEDLDRSPCMPF